MAIQIKGDGTFAAEYEGPYQGLDVQHPETLISDKASPSFNNFMLRNSEIRSRVALTQPFPAGSLELWPLGVSTFLDVNGRYHTVVWSGFNLYQYDPTVLPAFPWVIVGPSGPGNLQTNPVSYRAFANKIYYTDVGFIASPPHRAGGSSAPPTITPFVGYWDGLSAAPVYQQTYSDASISNSIAGISKADSPTVGGGLPSGPTMVGPLAIGAGFLSELDNHLILANISVKDQNSGIIFPYPNMIWWSANGLPLQWDPTQNTSAGFNAFLDVADQITGLAMLGVAGYIFRNYGITQMTPTGSAVTPFQFDHMWASEHGIGNVQPWSLAQYGPTCCFIAQDNIYSLSVTNAQPIGGTARDVIMADLANASSTAFANIVPGYSSSYVYLTYVILIPMGTFARKYVYSFEDKNWSTWDLAISGTPPFQFLTCAPNYV